METIAGAVVFDNRPARETPLIQPQAVWVHPSGDLYIADGNFLVRRVRGGISTIVAGGGALIDDSIPIPARNAHLDFPGGLAGTASGELFISDVRHNRIRRLNPDGTLVTVVGRGTEGFSGDGGRGAFAELSRPRAIALSDAGDLYIADTRNFRIRKFNLRTGIITSVAGTGESGYSGDGGLATEAKVGEVGAVAVDAAGNLYLTDTENFVVRKVSGNGVITTVAGNRRYGFSGDGGPATQASISGGWGLALDAAGNLYLADSENSRIRVVNPSGVINTYAGRGVTAGQPKNPGVENVAATEVVLGMPFAIALDTRGNLFIPESIGDLVRRVDAQTRIITTVAGTTNPFDGIAALDAPLVRPTDVAADSAGNLYVADNGHFRIRKLDASTGRITTIAGDGIEAGAAGSTSNSIGSGLSIS
ncbi:MAG: hypothetical protein ACRD8O_22785, partial [Bryobacteraceae bacterium]